MRLMLIDGRAISARSTAIAGGHALTECRLARPAMALLDDIDKDTVDFQENYDGNERGRWCCLHVSRICWSTAPVASQSAWPRIFRRTISAKSSMRPLR
jgi:hypothetical protein